MKRLRDFSDLENRKTLRFGLLLLSTLIIVSTSTLVYANMIYEGPLNTVNTNGASTESGSISLVGGGFVPSTVVLGLLGSIIGLSVFGFLRGLSKQRNHNDFRGIVSTRVQVSDKQGTEKPAMNDTAQ